jgi:hypothetical protein
MAQKRSSKGDGTPPSIQVLMDRLQVAGVNGVELVKGAVSYLWLVYLHDATTEARIIPVRKGRKLVNKIGGLTSNEWVNSAKSAHAEVVPPTIAEGRFILVAGDAMAGMKFFGPFHSEDAAREWAEEILHSPTWYVVEVDDQGGTVCA